MYELQSFRLTDLLECSSRLRRLGQDAASMEAASRAIVRFLYDHLIDKETGERALSLVRLYKTHAFGDLDAELQQAAQASAASTDRGESLAPDAPCLTLFASAGEEAEWNDRRRSVAHRAIPLHTDAALDSLPMVAGLVRGLGLAHSEVIRPASELFAEFRLRHRSVFYVDEADGSRLVPAQDFVERYGIRSVIGFGGVLPTGYVFAVILFAKVPVMRETADAFASLGFAAELALLPFVEGRIFDSSPAVAADSDPQRELRLLQARVAALDHLLDTRQEAVTDQAMRLEQAVRDAEDRAEALARSEARLREAEGVKAGILDAALDAIIVMDAEGRVVDFNPSAERIFGHRRDDTLGRRLADLIIPAELRRDHEAGLTRYLESGEGPILRRRVEVTGIRANGERFPVELTVVPVEVPGHRLFSGHLRDISERVAAEAELRAATERYAEIARTLQASLLPPVLPSVPGAEVASLYQAGYEGLDAGGDFYDVFEVAGGRWGLVLGDVMGKGPAAAAATALARYTVRAAAMRHRSPARVLAVLNEALHRNDPDRFCTAVFAVVDLRTRAAVSLGSAGHPPALLRTARGVTTLDAQGRLLGPFRQWSGKDRRYSLEPGDLLLFYSDGITESRRGDEFFGIDRLVEVLAATEDATAGETVRYISQQIGRFADAPDDDVAMLALRIDEGAVRS